MGYSISAATHDKIEQNRRDGRLCAGGASRHGCTTPAKVRVTTQSWPHAIGEGQMTERQMTFCERHWRTLPTRGVNFDVTGYERY